MSNFVALILIFGSITVDAVAILKTSFIFVCAGPSLRSLCLGTERAGMVGWVRSTTPQAPQERKPWPEAKPIPPRRRAQGTHTVGSASIWALLPVSLLFGGNPPSSGLLTGENGIYRQFSTRQISCLTHCKIADKKAAS
jgi:hypothetical protein